MKRLIAAALAAVATLCAGAAFAAQPAYPTKPVRFIVPKARHGVKLGFMSFFVKAAWTR